METPIISPSFLPVPSPSSSPYVAVRVDVPLLLNMETPAQLSVISSKLEVLSAVLAIILESPSIVSPFVEPLMESKSPVSVSNFRTIPVNSLPLEVKSYTSVAGSPSRSKRLGAVPDAALSSKVFTI